MPQDPSCIRVVHLTPFVPSPEGHGGNRRSYQVHRDLAEAVGEEAIATIDRPLDFVPAAAQQGWRRQANRVRRLLRTLRSNPLKPLRPTPFTPFLFSSPGLLARYEALVRTPARPPVCVVEHPGFFALARINRRYGVRAVACPQNIESLDTFVPSRQDILGLKAQALDLASELKVLAAWDDRLFISRVEAGLAGGLGLQGAFYPYLPGGEARERLLAVRAARARGPSERGLFVMLGTGGHPTTRAALLWWLEQARREPLPAGVRVVLGGLLTEDLATPERVPPGVELRGWIEPGELYGLLERACGFLIPQTVGFGAVTRLVDLACAGVPTIASEQALWPVSKPPGVYGVPNEWSTWRTQMLRLLDHDAAPDDSYHAWEAAQARPLGDVVRRLLREA